METSFVCMAFSLLSFVISNVGRCLARLAVRVNRPKQEERLGFVGLTPAGGTFAKGLRYAVNIEDGDSRKRGRSSPRKCTVHCCRGSCSLTGYAVRGILP